MEIKKINGYMIFINVVLGSGSFGTVAGSPNAGLQRNPKWYQNWMRDQNRVEEKKYFCVNSVSKDPYLKSAMDS